MHGVLQALVLRGEVGPEACAPEAQAVARQDRFGQFVRKEYLPLIVQDHHRIRAEVGRFPAQSAQGFGLFEFHVYQGRSHHVRRHEAQHLFPLTFACVALWAGEIHENRLVLPTVEQHFRAFLDAVRDNEFLEVRLPAEQIEVDEGVAVLEPPGLHRAAIAQQVAGAHLVLTFRAPACIEVDAGDGHAACLLGPLGVPHAHDGTHLETQQGGDLVKQGSRGLLGDDAVVETPCERIAGPFQIHHALPWH